MSPVRTLVSVLSLRTRALLVAATVTAAVARIAVYATAAGVLHERVALTASLAAGTAVAWLVQRALLSTARPEIETDVNRATSRALLESDVLAVPSEDVHRVVWDGAFHARALLGATVPAVGSDLAAALVLVPLVARELPARVVGLALAALAALALTTIALRRVTSSLQRTVLAAERRVTDELTTAIDGRLELVASGREEAFAATFETTLQTYRRVARRSSLTSAIIGRVPLAVGVSTVALVGLLDAAYGDAVASAVFGQALVIAAATAPVLAAVLGLNELYRASVLVGPFVDLLRSKRRLELARRNSGNVPSIPADVVAEQITFSYDEDASPVLADVTFHWKPGEALVLRGPNGCGKTTLLRLLIGLRAPSGGRLRIGGVPLDDIDLVHLRRSVSFLPQRSYLGEPFTTVRDGFAIACGRVADDVLLRALERVHLAVSLDRRVGELSAGQRQRMALARVLVQDMPIVLLDEPDANLDSDGIAVVARLIADLVEHDKMVALAAHTMGLAAVGGCTVVLGSAGRAKREAAEAP